MSALEHELIFSIRFANFLSSAISFFNRPAGATSFITSLYHGAPPATKPPAVPADKKTKCSPLKRRKCFLYPFDCRFLREITGILWDVSLCFVTIQSKRDKKEILCFLLFRQPKDHWQVLLGAAPHLAVLLLKDHMGREILSGSRHISRSHRKKRLNIFE